MICEPQRVDSIYWISVCVGKGIQILLMGIRANPYPELRFIEPCPEVGQFDIGIEFLPCPPFARSVEPDAVFLLEVVASLRTFWA